MDCPFLTKQETSAYPVLGWIFCWMVSNSPQTQIRPSIQTHHLLTTSSTYIITAHSRHQGLLPPARRARHPGPSRLLHLARKPPSPSASPVRFSVRPPTPNHRHVGLGLVHGTDLGCKGTTAEFSSYPVLCDCGLPLGFGGKQCQVHFFAPMS